MPRTDIARAVALGPYDETTVNVVYTAADLVNFNRFLWTGKEILLVRNPDVVPRIFTLTSVLNRWKRLGNLTPSMIAGASDVYGPFTEAEGWVQPDGYIYCQGETGIVFAVLVLP